MDLGSEDLKSQVFATIYETEGLAHHMAVERAHVSWLHIEKQESEEINILRGVRQGDSISPKLFTAAIQEVFKNSDLQLRDLDIDGERLTDLRFADDVALTTNTIEDMEQHLNILNEQSKRVGLKIHRGKTKFLTNFSTTQKY